MLDPQAERFLADLAALGEPAIDALTPREARASRSRLQPAGAFPRERLARVEDRSIPGPHGPIPLRIYVPQAAEPLGVLVYFHGGGWVLGDLDMVDLLAGKLAQRAECIVVSVDYRLAPEHPFPIPFDEAYAATLWSAAHAGEFGGDPTRLAVGGDSAGGNLAAAVTLAARDRNGPSVRMQLLLYPVTDRDFTRVSYTAFGAGYFLTTAAMQWFWNHYLPASTGTENPYAAPLRAASLHRLPPAFIVIAGFDPLRDEGEAYAAALRDAGVAVDERLYPGMLHGFLTVGAFDAGDAAITACAGGLRSAFAAIRA